MLKISSALLFLTLTEASIRWLGVDRAPGEGKVLKSQLCSKSYGLTGRQVKFCNENFERMQFVPLSAQETKEECQKQMQLRLWNCASINRAPNFNEDLNTDTREAGFVQALSAAAVALAVGRGCLAGNLRKCACSQGNRQLSLTAEEVNKTSIRAIEEKLGCRNVLDNAKRFSIEFSKLGLRQKPRTLGQYQEVAIKRHNIEAGLKTLDEASTIECICNGATASCAVKICYRRVAHLAEVAGQLVDKYEKAVKSKLVVAEGELVPFAERPELPKISADNIAYLDDTPNPCSAPSVASDPHYRRPCIPNGTDSNSCEKLCCGRGYQQRTIEVATQCNCKFQFCCQVQCETCMGQRSIFECV